jgi:hypothetical protein
MDELKEKNIAEHTARTLATDELIARYKAIRSTMPYDRMLNTEELERLKDIFKD